MIPEQLKQYQFFRLPPPVLMIAVSLILMGVILVFPLSITWATRQDYSYGYILPIFVLYVLYDRWDKIFSYFKRPGSGADYGFGSKLVSAGFGMVFVLSLLTYLLGLFIYSMTGHSGSPVFIMTFGFSWAVISMAFFGAQFDNCGGRKSIRERIAFVSLFVFPAFSWLIAAPVFDSVMGKLGVYLLAIVAQVVYFIMDFLGFVVTLRQNVLEFPTGSVGVADACSGIRSLTACLFAGSFLAAVFLDKLWKKIALVILSMVFAFINNILRALFLSLWAYQYGSDSISGFVHDAAGYFVMGVTVVILLMLLPLFQLSPVPKEVRIEEAKKERARQKALETCPEYVPRKR